MKPTDAQAAEDVTKLIRYLQQRYERLNYHVACKGGHHYGSGETESANKSIRHVCLKRSGLTGM